MSSSLSDFSFKSAIFIGILQVLSLVPGVSRSGITITAARILEFKRFDSAKISFLLSIPTLGAVSLFGLSNMILSENLNLPNAPDNMRSGNGIGPNDNPDKVEVVFTNKEKSEIQTTINGYIESGDSIDDMGFKLGSMASEKQMSIKQMHHVLTTFNSKVQNYTPGKK